jgi:hypothetical protein
LAKGRWGLELGFCLGVLLLGLDVGEQGNILGDYYSTYFFLGNIGRELLLTGWRNEELFDFHWVKGAFLFSSILSGLFVIIMEHQIILGVHEEGPVSH